MKAFVFVNDNGAAYCRYAKNEIPAQFVYGVSKLEKMGFEVKVGEGRLFKDLVSFWKFKPDLFFMPFLKRKTMLYFILAKILCSQQNSRAGCISTSFRHQVPDSKE
ncbi:TPA: hypothetical protein QH575_000448 [Enterobacter kobei]|nr:hypothetical protein [Enterobacter kobei]